MLEKDREARRNDSGLTQNWSHNRYQLKWNKHNVEHCKTISKSIALLRKAKSYVSQEVLVTMYNSLVLPHFNYCSTIWHDDNNTQNIENLLKLQKRVARIMTSSDYCIRSHQTILDKRELLLMFKIIKGKAPNYLTMLFSNCNNINYQLEIHACSNPRLTNQKCNYILGT